MHQVNKELFIPGDLCRIKPGFSWAPTGIEPGLVCEILGPHWPTQSFLRLYSEGLYFVYPYQHLTPCITNNH